MRKNEDKYNYVRVVTDNNPCKGCRAYIKSYSGDYYHCIFYSQKMSVSFITFRESCPCVKCLVKTQCQNEHRATSINPMLCPFFNEHKARVREVWYG